MITIQNLTNILKKKEINFFTGVPDSVLKDFTFQLNKLKKNHISVNNEGTAISLAAGYYLATGKIPCVYMQNSGLGNAINPLISITNKNVYSIPSILIIGWRGGPNSKDEPQHQTMGKITKNILKLLQIKFCILKNNTDLIKFEKLIEYSKKKRVNVACLIEKSKIEKNIKKFKKLKINNYKILRFNFLKELVYSIKVKSNIVSSTGYISRELNQILNQKKNKKIKPFYMVGGMGHAASLTLGVSLKSNIQNICLDGDGSLLMHTGSLGIISKFGKKNFKYILFRNDSHESVGGQTTNSNQINYETLSKSFGFHKYFLIKSNSRLKNVLKNFLNHPGPIFLEVKIKNKSVDNLGRPKNLKIIKKKFMLK
jgi:phosphonopyruvate decarboxylase